MGQPDWLDEFEDDWLEFSVTPDKVRTFQNGFAEWVRGLTKDAVSEEAQRLGVPLVPVTRRRLKTSPQYRHRGFFRDVTHPVLGTAAYPGVPYLLSASPAQITSAAPALGNTPTTSVQHRRADTAVKVNAQLKPPRCPGAVRWKACASSSSPKCGPAPTPASCWPSWAPR